jgi:cytochrome b involved in lipid metabolism
MSVMRKKYLLLPFLIVLPFLFINFVYAQEESNEQGEIVEYTMEEVAQHNEEGDCWMIFEDYVYDFSEYLPDHDKYMDIKEWCGTDMTQDFTDKAGIGRDHVAESYNLLERYKIGDLKGEVELVDTQILIEDVQEESLMEDKEEETTKSRDYNIIIPFILTTIFYWSMYFLIKKDKFFGITIHKFNMFWSTTLLLLLLIPGMAFGIFMMLRIKKSQLWDIDFDFMYWHVELSLVMGFVAIYHFIQRIPQYIAQLKRKRSV